MKCGNQTREHQSGHQSFQELRTSVFNFSNLPISDFTHSHPIVMYSEPPASMQRWQCLIHNGTLDTMFFSIMIELIVVFLDFNVFNSDISNKFSYVTYICYSVEKPCNWYISFQNCKHWYSMHYLNRKIKWESLLPKSVGPIPSGFNGSVNIPESCDFRSQFDPLNVIC